VTVRDDLANVKLNPREQCPAYKTDVASAERMAAIGEAIG
jgi:hypothetical protein